jgi:hypothetical protein
MRPRLIAATLLVTAACASAIRPAQVQRSASAEERAAARAHEQRVDELEQALAALSLAEKQPDCPRTCELVEQICDLSRRICLIARRHGDDPDLAGRCAAAEQRCRGSRDRVPPSCSCQAR